MRGCTNPGCGVGVTCVACYIPECDDMTPHQCDVLHRASRPDRSARDRGTITTVEISIVYEPGCGWYVGCSALDGQTAHSLIRLGMITLDDSMGNGPTEYYKLTAEGRRRVGQGE